MSDKYAALIRHGDYHQIPQVPSAYQPFSLNDDGIEQARTGAETLKSIIDEHGLSLSPTVVCSSLLRAWQTADIIRQNLSGLDDIESHDDLAERSVGAVANLTVSEIEQILETDPRYDTAKKGWKSDSHYRLPFIGAESLMEAGKRVSERLTRSLQKTPEDHLSVFVAHGASLRHAAHHLGILKFDEIAKLSMYHAHPVVFKIDSKGTWSQVGGDWKVRTPKDRNMD